VVAVQAHLVAGTGAPDARQVGKRCIVGVVPDARQVGKRCIVGVAEVLATAAVEHVVYYDLVARIALDTVSIRAANRRHVNT